MILFNKEMRRSVIEANINYYANPFVHPKRIMPEHDFIYMLDGKWEIGQNGNAYTLTNDTLLILAGSYAHKGLAPCTENTKTMYFHVTSHPDDCLCDTPPKNDRLFALPEIIHVGGNPNIKKLFYQVLSAQNSGNVHLASVYFDLLLCSLSEFCRAPDNGEVGEKIIDIINASPERFFGNREIADQLGISVKSAQDKFKARYGITIHQYILEHKIKTARSYLDTFPHMQIKDIAQSLGFYDEYHFSKQFKKAVGICPTAYRKK